MRSFSVITTLALAEARSHPRGYIRAPAELRADIPVLSMDALNMVDVPDAVDWSVNATTPVKDQGQCGSCWVFSTMEGVESAIYMKTGKMPPLLSTEELVSCDKGQDDGCNGGDIVTGVHFLKKHVRFMPHVYDSPWFALG
jgi:C1A family cysteine protease